MKFDRSKIENSSGFKEIWNIDYPETKVSTRRRNQKRGWINKEYFSFEIQRVFSDFYYPRLSLYATTNINPWSSPT